MFSQIVEAVKACHMREGGAVLHRDLKPANIFLDGSSKPALPCPSCVAPELKQANFCTPLPPLVENIKVGDFGLARVLGAATRKAQTVVGTPYYMSPVRTGASTDTVGRVLMPRRSRIPIQEQMSESAYDEKSDIWSLGCLLYEMCALSRPFRADTRPALAAKIQQGYSKSLPSQ